VLFSAFAQCRGCGLQVGWEGIIEVKSFTDAQNTMQLTDRKKKSLRNTVAGNALYSKEFNEMMPVFSEVSLELALLGDRLFSTVCVTDPKFETCDDVRRARDEVADQMIRLMQKWKAA